MRIILERSLYNITVKSKQLICNYYLILIIKIMNRWELRSNVQPWSTNQRPNSYQNERRGMIFKRISLLLFDFIFTLSLGCCWNVEGIEMSYFRFLFVFVHFYYFYLIIWFLSDWIQCFFQKHFCKESNQNRDFGTSCMFSFPSFPPLFYLCNY